MTIDKKEAKKLANSILEKHENKSYRKMAKEDYPSIIKPGTLCRIAKSGGKWLPKNKKILIALGLLYPVKMPAYIIKWRHLPTEERHKVIQQYLAWKEKQ